MNASFGKLTIFETDESITVSFEGRVYIISSREPFYNIAKKCLEIDDMVPFYIEIARREGKGEAFRNRLLEEIERLEEGEDAEWGENGDWDDED